MKYLVSILYYLGTLSIITVVVTYPRYWINYARRPGYILANQTDTVSSNSSSIVTYTLSSYSILQNETAQELCHHFTSLEEAEERLRFSSEINTWFVLFFTVCDWIIMIICSIGAMVIFYKTNTEPEVDMFKYHITIESLSLISLIFISPLSYPSLIDEYAECLDNNPFMKYDIFLGIQFLFFVSLGFCGIMFVLFNNESQIVETWGKPAFSKLFFFVRGVSLALLLVFFAISLAIMIGTNSLLILMSTVLDSGVGIYIIYTDSLRGKDLTLIIPNPKSIDFNSS